jgi:hypothetical protein
MADSQHLAYRGVMGHIHMVLYESATGEWRHRDVSEAAKATAVVPAGDPAVYVIPETSQHVTYATVDGRIYKLHYDGMWHVKDLSTDTSAPGFAVGRPAAFVIPGQSQHVVYRDADGEIRMVLYEDQKQAWRHSHVSAAPDSPGPHSAGDPAAFRIGGNQHIVYRGIDFRIHMLLYETGPGKWRHADLNERANATEHQSANGDPAAFAIGSHQYVYYRGTEGRIHELKYEGKWVHTDLNKAANAIGFGAASGAGPAAFFIPGQSRHVVYRGNDSHIYMLIREGSKWRHVDVNERVQSATGFLPPPAAPGTPAAFPLVGQSQHVAYRGGDGHLHMVLYENGKQQWRHVDVSVAAKAIPFLPVGDPAGYVYHIEEGGSFWGDLWNGIKGAIKFGWNSFWGGASIIWDLVGTLFIPVGFILNLILMIPVVGGLLRILLDVFTGLVLGIVGLIVETVLCGILGICPLKHLRLCVVMFTDDGEPLLTESGLAPLLERTTQIFKDEAQIEIISRFTIYKKAEGTRAMNPPCDTPLLVEEAVGVVGTQYQQAAMSSCLRWGTSSVIGLGSPIYAFGVNDVRGKNGCSLWLAANYLVFEPNPEPFCDTHLAHEIGHACGLWHQDADENLMRKKCVDPGRDQLKQWQKMIVRGSKYATYW